MPQVKIASRLVYLDGPGYAGRENGMSKNDDREMAETFFSEDLKSRFHRVQEARSKTERDRLMMEFAESFASEYDATDHTANEHYHEFIEEFEKAKLDFKQASMRLARMGVDLMEHALAGEAPINDGEEDEAPNQALRRLN